MPRPLAALVALVAATIMVVATPPNANAQRGGRGGRGAGPADGGPNGLGALHFRFLGPEGNRVAAITGVPGDPTTVYIGAADGGIWKTSDAGIDWQPVFDQQDVAAIGALAVAQSAHDVVWAGTGETVAHPPLLCVRRRRLQVHRRRPDVAPHGARRRPAASRASSSTRRTPTSVYVCAMGQGFRPQRERGVFHTTDGGATWKQVARRQRQHRLLRAVDGPQRPEDALRRHVAARRPALGPAQRRPRQRRVRHPRRRQPRGRASPATASRRRTTRWARSRWQ